MAAVSIIIGEDDYLVEEAAAKILGDRVGLEIIDSANSGNEETQLADLRRVVESVQMPPFFDPKKITWWKNVNFLPSGGKGGPGEAVKAALEKFAGQIAATPLPENQQFLITAPKLLSSSIFAKRLAKVAEITEFKTPKYADQQQRQALARLPELAARFSLVFAPKADESFVKRVGNDTRSILSELGKLRDYLGAEGGAVTSAAVDEICSPGVGCEPEISSVSDAVAARQPEAALAALKRFEGENGFAVLMTTVLEKLFRQLAELKDAEERGTFAAATEGLAPFIVRKLSGNLSKWNLRELRRARAAFLRLREKVVSAGGGDALNEMVVVELVRCLGSIRRK